MSFVNLMANDVWSETDIVTRTEAMIASEFPPAAAAILNRKATGALLGQYALTPGEQAELGRYAAVCDAARAAGTSARADVALLIETLALEAAVHRLKLQEVTTQEGVAQDDGRYALDVTERAQAAHIVASASPGAVALAELRQPPVLDEALQ